MTKNLREFLDEYKKLCDKYNCLVLSDGESVEACECLPGESPSGMDYWSVEEYSSRQAIKRLNQLRAGIDHWGVEWAAGEREARRLLREKKNGGPDARTNFSS